METFVKPINRVQDVNQAFDVVCVYVEGSESIYYRLVVGNKTIWIEDFGIDVIANIYEGKIQLFAEIFNTLNDAITEIKSILPTLPTS